MRILAFSVFLFFNFLGSAQDDKALNLVIQDLKSEAELYLTSYINEDWDTFKKYLHPNVTKMAGGDAMMIRLAGESIQMYKGLGFIFKSVRLAEEIQIADSDEWIQAIVPAVMILESGSQKLELPLKLFGISSDGGKNWSFVDLSQYNAENIAQFVPEFSDELKAYW